MVRCWALREQASLQASLQLFRRMSYARQDERACCSFSRSVSLRRFRTWKRSRTCTHTAWQHESFEQQTIGMTSRTHSLPNDNAPLPACRAIEMKKEPELPIRSIRVHRPSTPPRVGVVRVAAAWPRRSAEGWCRARAALPSTCRAVHATRRHGMSCGSRKHLSHDSSSDFGGRFSPSVAQELLAFGRRPATHGLPSWALWSMMQCSI